MAEIESKLNRMERHLVERLEAITKEVDKIKKKEENKKYQIKQIVN